MQSIISLSLKGYLKELGRKIPAPGGGSAAALVAATGISLYKKCLEYSKKNFSKKEIDKAIKNTEKNINSMLLLVEKDKRAYSLVSKCLKNNSSKAKLQSAYTKATLVPLEMVRISHAALLGMNTKIAHINKNLFSDLKAGYSFIKSGLMSASILIVTNAKSLSGENRGAYKEYNKIMKKIRPLLVKIEKELDHVS